MYTRTLPAAGRLERIAHLFWRTPVGYRFFRALREHLPSRLLLLLPDLTRTEVLNLIAKKLEARRYLEIGVGSGENFLAVKVPNKVGVDPIEPSCRLRGALSPSIRYYRMTSEEFFESVQAAAAELTFDLVFIDGLHVYEQVVFDLQGVRKLLSKKAVVVLQDCNPRTSAEGFRAGSYLEAKNACPPGWNGYWCGDVWKAFVQILQENQQIPAAVLDCDFGLGVIVLPDGHYEISSPKPDLPKLSFQHLAANRVKLLNLVPPVRLLKLLRPVVG